MKRIFLYAGIGLLALYSCNSKKSDETQNALAQDSIEIESLSSQKDSLMSLVGDISNSLAEINRLEGIVSSQDFKSESPAQKTQILNNIEAVKRELAARRIKMDELEAKLKKNNGYSADLKKTIDSQKQLIDEQTKKIESLEADLAKANVKIAGLNTRVDSLNTEVSNVSHAKQVAEQRSTDLDNRLNTCFYVVDTNKALKNKRILEKKFLSRTKVMEGNFDRSAFVKADKRTLTEIATGHKSAKVLSKQPVESYRIVDVNGRKVLKIINPTLFWEKSDFLVIEVK